MLKKREKKKGGGGIVLGKRYEKWIVLIRKLSNSSKNFNQNTWERNMDKRFLILMQFLTESNFTRQHVLTENAGAYS